MSVKVLQWLNETVSWGTLCSHWLYESWVLWTVTYQLLLLHLPASLLMQWQWVAVAQPEGSVKQAFDLLGKTWRYRQWGGGRTPSLTKAHSKQGLDCRGPLSWPSPDTHCTSGAMWFSTLPDHPKCFIHTSFTHLHRYIQFFFPKLKCFLSNIDTRIDALESSFGLVSCPRQDCRSQGSNHKPPPSGSR